ncbi:MAG: peptidoglycan editing factor PgeF [Christensenellales bacterium]
MQYFTEDDFAYVEKAGCGLFQSSLLQQTKIVRHCFTSRIGGVSPSPFDTLNMGLKRPDKRENVLENYKRVCRFLDVDYESLIIANYTHGTNVEAVTATDAGRGIHREPLGECDGLVTNEKGLPIVTLHADCLPVFFLDPIHNAIGLCHAGWRGVYGKTSVNVLLKMNQCYQTQPFECLIAIGPAIQSCCFEVDEPIAQMFSKEYPQHVFQKDKRKYTVDLSACLSQQLLNAGAIEQNMAVSKHCTTCEKEYFFSARAQITTGAMASIMMLA